MRKNAELHEDHLKGLACPWHFDRSANRDATEAFETTLLAALSFQRRRSLCSTLNSFRQPATACSARRRCARKRPSPTLWSQLPPKSTTATKHATPINRGRTPKVSCKAISA